MARMFEVSELVQVAVDDEKSGVAFYSALAGKVKDAKLKDTFNDLAEQERYHQKRFEQMLKDIGEHRPAERYADEYATYLRALTSDRAFPDETAAVRAAEQCADDLAAVNLSLRFERDTLILMNEMRSLVHETDRSIVDELIKEEQSHLVTLTAARDRLLGRQRV